MRIGFICEGKTERKIISSDAFIALLTELGLSIAGEAIDAKGNGNLLPEHLEAFVKSLTDAGAERIIVLTDLDEDKCITLTKQRINPQQEHIVIVAVKQIEAWFLADSICMSSIMKASFSFEEPEKVNALEEIKNALLHHTGNGASDKVILAGKVLRNGFSIVNAAKHPNCNSAKYFVQKLTELSQHATK